MTNLVLGEIVEVRVEPNASETIRQRVLAQAANTGAEAALSTTQLVRDQAADLVLPQNIFVDESQATAEAAVAEGTTYKLVDSSTGLATVYLRTAIGSDELYSETTTAALASTDAASGATRVFLEGGGSVGNAIKWVTPDMRGGTGDDLADDTAAVQAALNSSRHVIIPVGKVYRTTALTVPDNTTIAGAGTIKLTSGKITLGSGCRVIEVAVNGHMKANADHGLYCNGQDDIRIEGVRFNQIGKSAIDANNTTNIFISGCTADEIGDGANETNEGMFVQLVGCVGFSITNNPRITRTYGHAAIMVRTGSQDGIVANNGISETFFRGIQVFSNGHKAILINGNRIARTGEINTTGSGVACNGIYVVTASSSPELVHISDNHIESVAENGIEVLGGAFISGNTVKTTGYRSLTTPSKEGIYVGGGCVCTDNLIIDAANEGIKHYTTGTTAKLEVSGNTIINAGTRAMNLQFDTATGLGTNVVVKGNTVFDPNGTMIGGINLGGSAGGTADATCIVFGNRVPSDLNNGIGSAVVVTGNSWQSGISPFSFDFAARYTNTNTNDAGGGFKRRYDSYGIFYNGTTFTLNGTGARTMWAHDNSSFAVYVVPAAVASPISNSTLAGYKQWNVNESGDWGRSGTTANRPTANLQAGHRYFDTTLNKPIWRNAANTAWNDATGVAV